MLHASTPPLSFLQAGCPYCRPTNSVKALKAVLQYKHKHQCIVNVNVRCTDEDDSLARNMPASQVSTYIDAVAGLAVDGIATTMACTHGYVHPWWSVDLGGAFSVGHVTVTNDINPAQGNCRRTSFVR